MTQYLTMIFQRIVIIVTYVLALLSEHNLQKTVSPCFLAGSSPARAWVTVPSGRMQPIQNSMINLTKKKTTSREKWIKKQQNPTYIWRYLRLALLTFHFFSHRVKHLLVLPECNCCLWHYNLNPSPSPTQPKAEFRYCSSPYKATERKPLPGSQKAGERLNSI